MLNVHLDSGSYLMTSVGSPCFLYRRALHVCARSLAELLKGDTLELTLTLALALALHLIQFKRAATTLLPHTVWPLKHTLFKGENIATHQLSSNYESKNAFQ